MKPILLSLYLLLTNCSLDLDQYVLASKIYSKSNSIELISISFVESRLGKYPINLQDPSCGVFHIHIKYLLKQLGLKDTPFNRNKLCSDLLDLDYSISLATNTLDYFYKYHKQDYKKTIQSFNSGFSLFSYNYFFKVKNTTKEIKQCLKLNILLNRLFPKSYPNQPLINLID